MAKIYKRKPVVVEAVQFTGNNYDEVIEFAKGNFVVTHRYEGRDVSYGVFINDKIVTVQIGDYVVKNTLDDELWVCSSNIFHKTFEEVPF